MRPIYEIGKNYDVKCGRIDTSHFGNYFNPGEWVPLIGEKHCDAEIINFPIEHYHVDWRFVTTGKFKRVKERYWPKEHNYYLAIVMATHAFSEIKTIRLKMLRQMPDYPNPVRFTHELEAHYKNATAKKHRCPHQGADLSSIAPNDQGQIVCPLHGLRFCQKSLKLITTI